ncbi:MAG: U32 family peptidase [Clostridiaceae bacterium]|nr:U32 family peptidase [Clostridiaceae bacterium]
MTESRTDRSIELLAPAGDMDKLQTAIQYGADAVYLAVRQFGLRAASANFSETELAEAVEFAHQRSVRVYLTLNSLAHPEDYQQLAKKLDRLLSTGPDAVIVSDAGVFQLVRAMKPEQKIHISTQASVTNAAACAFWYQQGAKRIILARELTLSEIAQIRRETPNELELEGFVHGAMCMAYSGRCLLSNFLTGRDANRGQCAQPCRWSYELREKNHHENTFEIEEGAEGTYFLNSRDLCLVNHLPELASAGLGSFKIEGRVKSSYYLATVVKTYRTALDAYLKNPLAWQPDPKWLAELEKTVHRPFDTGFYFDRPQNEAKISLDETDQHQATVVGLVKAWLPDSGLILIEQRNRIFEGEPLEVMQPNGENKGLKATGLLDLERRPIKSTPHPKMLYFMPVEQPVLAGSWVRRLS